MHSCPRYFLDCDCAEDCCEPLSTAEKAQLYQRALAALCSGGEPPDVINGARRAELENTIERLSAPRVHDAFASRRPLAPNPLVRKGWPK